MSTTQVPNPSRPRITNKTLMQRYDGIHRGLRGCQGRLNGGIEMPFCERSTGYAEARVNVVDLASEADGGGLASLKCYIVSVLPRRGTGNRGKRRKICAIMTRCGVLGRRGLVQNELGWPSSPTWTVRHRIFGLRGDASIRASADEKSNVKLQNASFEIIQACPLTENDEKRHQSFGINPADQPCCFSIFRYY